MTPPLQPRLVQVRLKSPTGLEIPSNVESYPGRNMVIAAAGSTPIAKLHGAFVSRGIDSLQLAVTVVKNLLGRGRVAPGDVTDLSVASSVPFTGTTWIGTSLRNRAALDSVVRPLHINALCCGGAASIARTVEGLALRGSGIGVAIGADDQSLGEIFMNRQFRDVLQEVTGRRLPMQFGLSMEAAQDPSHPDNRRMGISPQDFATAVAVYVHRHGSVPGLVHDGILDSFRDTTNPNVGYMWTTAARIAEAWGFSTAEAVAIAAESHRRVWAARDSGVYDGILIPVPGSGLDFHENPLRNPTRLGRGETAPGVTSATSSQMGGSAAGALIMSQAEATRRGIPVAAEIVGYSFSQVDPDVMGLGPAAASKGLLDYLGLTIDQMGHIEVNEAFAGVVHAFNEQMMIQGSGACAIPKHVNPWGGAIATGHVMGAKFLEMTALATRFFELNPDREYALVTLCGGGGQGAAMVLRNPRHVKGIEHLAQPTRSTLSTRNLSTRQRNIVTHLLECGYLVMEQLIIAIRTVTAEFGRTLPFPTNNDINFVLRTNGGRLMDPADLLRRASIIAQIRGREIGSSETLGERIGVVGAGEMGHQLAYEYARAGYEVHLADQNTELANAGRERVAALLYGAVGRGLYTAEEAGAILARIHVTGSMAQSLRDVQGEGGRFHMVIEAATENVALKQRIFSELRDAAVTGTILATNTSSITAAAAGADAVIHYFNPVHAMPVVDGFVGNLSAEQQAWVAGVMANTRKGFYTTEVDAPGSIVNPLFASTYFAADRLPELAQTVAREATAALDDAKGPQRTALEAIIANPHTHAMALIDACYVEATRSEPQPAATLTAKPLDASQGSWLGKTLRRGGMGVFRLIDETGGPKPYVETSDNTASFYGNQLKVGPLVRAQLALADLRAKEAREPGSVEPGAIGRALEALKELIGVAFDTANGWLQGRMDHFTYDTFVREQVQALQEGLGANFVQNFRTAFHARAAANKLHLIGEMHDRGVVNPDTPDFIDNGAGMGLGWRSTPEALLRAYPSRAAVRELLENQGLSIPTFFEGDAPLPALDPVKLNFSPDGKTAHIRMNRPRVRNAVNQSAVEALARHADTIDASDATVVILDGEGKNFIAGADLDWFKARQDKSAELRAAGDEPGAIAELAKIYDAFSLHEIAAMEKLSGDPNRLTVAVVRGMNVGGGVEAVAQADFVIHVESFEGESVKYFMPEASIGIGIGYGAHVNLGNKVGTPLAKRILLTGRQFATGEAVQMGFANASVRHDQLPDFLATLTAAWNDRGETDKAEFIAQRSETAAKSPELAAAEKLWSDPLAVKCMVKGQVPPWLEGPELKLAQREVAAIRRGSPEAIAMLNDMVDQGNGYDLRSGLIHIFDTPNARAGIAGRARGFKWPVSVEVVAAIKAMAEERTG